MIQAICLLFSLLAALRNDALFQKIYTLMAFLAASLAKKDYYAEKIYWVKRLFDRNHPSLTVTRKILQQTNPRHRRTLVKSAIINQLLVGTNRRKAFCEKNNGLYPPGFFVISPSMKCDLHCFGCYAGSYTKSAELSFEEIDDALDQAKAMGLYFCVVSGGEPFFYPRIFELFKKHNDMIFHVYTHGGLIDEAVTGKLAKAGNVIPAISVEGFEKQTDERRGKGHWAKVIKAMELLRKAKILFGFSATLTRHNADLLSSDRFIDTMIDAGCVLGWYFMYVPVGFKPDMNLMMTPRQRGRQFERLVQLRNNKPILLADFWNDGPVVGGCISGGRKYLHVNANGDIEPCVFCHFATHNIRTHTLREAVSSPLFKSIRCELGKDENLLRPCIIVDRPHIGRSAIEKHNAYFTHKGAEIVYSSLAQEIDGYAAGYGKVADELWKKYFCRKN
ncbi:MAG: radical SAM protein [Desulfobacteraceae bacterium]|nr:radical SAM protein [Desulfobacteraceae bacterium]